MHVLRTTLFSAPTPDDSLTIVVRESDVRSFGEVLAKPNPRTFLTHDVFEMPDGDITAATAHAMRRNHDKQQYVEVNMAVSFFWNAEQLQRCAKGGHLVNPAPAPYTAEQCREVLLQLYQHPNYDGQTIIQNAEDGQMVVLFPNGKVKIG